MIYRVADKRMAKLYLHDVGLPVNDRLDKDCIAKAALADDLELSVLLHLLLILSLFIIINI